MSQVNSWIQLDSVKDELQLSQKIRQEDEFQGVDIGWVSQMRPFIKEFSNRGDLVLEPFAGIGTTLVAAQLENRSSLGIELESSRVKLITERWLECGFNLADLNVTQGDCVSELSRQFKFEERAFIDFCITSVPYFGSEWRGSMLEEQLYSKTYYADYLDYMKQLFFILKKVMKENSYLVFMAENIRNFDGTLLPIAWDLGKVLGKYFNVYDERIITYSKDSTSSDKPCIHTNRAHEYAIITKNEAKTVSLIDGVKFLSHLNGLGFEFIVYGSFSSLIRNEAQIAQDIDLIFCNTSAVKKDILNRFLMQGADIFCNEKLVNKSILDNNFEAHIDDRYFRVLLAGEIGQVDLVFIESNEFYKIETVKQQTLLNYSFLNNIVAKKNIKLNDNWEVYLSS